MRSESKQIRFIKDKIGAQHQPKFKNIEEEKRKYMEKLKKGSPEEIKERRKKIYQGKTLESEKIEQNQQISTGKIDIQSYKKAYMQWLSEPQPKGPKPEPKNFAIKKIPASEDNQKTPK